MNSESDQGKVWLKGSFKPVYSVRVNDQTYALDLDTSAPPEWRWAKEHLQVDIHEPGNKRIARKFPPNVKATAKGTLFSGFDNTKHADVEVVLPTDVEVVSIEFNGDDYAKVKDLTSEQFWEEAGF